MTQTNRPASPLRRREVRPVGYQPAQDYSLDVEIFPARELQRRAGDVGKRGFERIDFHCILYVTSGRYVHVVDFAMLDCARGSIIVLQPGQVHRFGDLSNWEGWLAVFRSEMLPSRLNASKTAGDIEVVQYLNSLPMHLVLSADTQVAVSEAMERMVQDSARPTSAALKVLLRSQMDALVARLCLEGPNLVAKDAITPVLIQRFQRYRAAVERDYANRHDVAHYAKALGCSAKSLTRASLMVSDRNAKAVLTDRIVLEAKRLLAHSVQSVANIGDQLGFSEATNFVKVFRRETGLTPSAFRAQLSGLKGRFGGRVDR